jgi:predicted deacetylase
VTVAAATAFPAFTVAAASPKQPLIVSLHDVAPSTRAACEKIVRELARHHVDVCSLLVVPNYHGRGASTADREFVRWLRGLEADGHEIVIHGYFHRRPARERETLRERLITGAYTAGEGEFYDLDYADALERITRARDEFVAAGLRPRGFIAPAWLLGSEAERAAADAEMEYTTRLTNILDLRTRKTFYARSMVYSVRSGWRRGMSQLWNRGLFLLQSDSPLVRLGIHPPDATHHTIWGQILRITDQLAESRTPTTYRDWLAEQRLGRTETL